MFSPIFYLDDTLNSACQCLHSSRAKVCLKSFLQQLVLRWKLLQLKKKKPTLFVMLANK